MNERVSAERRSAGPNVTEFSDRQCEMNECVSILIQIFVIDNKRDQVMCRVLRNTDDSAFMNYKRRSSSLFRTSFYFRHDLWTVKWERTIEIL